MDDIPINNASTEIGKPIMIFLESPKIGLYIFSINKGINVIYSAHFNIILHNLRD